MAVLDSLPGVEVTIWSEGSKLKEYDDDGDQVRQSWKHKTVSKYIESETDAAFYFKLQVGKPYEHDCDELGFAIILDGCEENIDSHLCCSDDLEDDDEWELDVHGVETHDAEGAKIKRFRFAKLHKTDGETRYLTKAEVKDLQKIGQIEVRVHQMSHCRRTKRKPKQFRGPLGVLPEKIFGGQAISHSISFEVEEVLSAPSFYQGTEYMHGWDGPIGIFRFKYRSRGDLQKELIIPRTPTPEPAGPPSAATLTSEQKFQLARMRYDDLEMLKSLTAVRGNSAGQKRQDLQRRFEDLTPEEVDLLALQKHAAMTGVPCIKPEPSITIKREPGTGSGAPIGSSITRRRPFPVISIIGGKRAVDLTVDEDEDEDEDEDAKGQPDPRLVTPHRIIASSRSKSRTITAPARQKVTPSSRRSVCLDDDADDGDDELVIYAARRVKKPRTEVVGRSLVSKKER